MKDYHFNVFCSDEDEGYIADIPDLKYCSAFGETPEEALNPTSFPYTFLATRCCKIYVGHWPKQEPVHASDFGMCGHRRLSLVPLSRGVIRFSTHKGIDHEILYELVRQIHDH